MAISRTRITAHRLIQAIGIYSCLAVGLVTTAVLGSHTADRQQKAVIQMAVGLILIWIVAGGWLMRRYREPVVRTVRAIRLNWRVKFVVFATFLALLEEAVTVSMTNLAPVFGSKVGEAYITASANYLHTVLFHSVIFFIPMFVTWSFLLGRYDFEPPEVFLLFGFTGSLAEASIQLSSLLAGFWFFVYGLMVYLPACSIPIAAERRAVRPRLRHYLLAAFVPIVSPVMLLPLLPVLRYLYRVMDPVFFVESPFG